MRMNKYIYASLFLLTGAMTSCDDILDAPTISATDESVVFSNYTLAENAFLLLWHEHRHGVVERWRNCYR